MAPLDHSWLKALEYIDYAFQPIVNIYSGECYGYEALLRGFDRAGFATIQALLDAAASQHVLHQVDLQLREIAVRKFTAISNGRTKLFFNLDNRLLSSGDYASGETMQLLARYGLPRECICFEISEKHEIFPGAKITDLLTVYRRQGFRIAVDDFGAGFSGLKLLYIAEPDFLKIDHFFVKEIAKDSRKRLFVSSIVNIAHIIGSQVIAEGVETEAEYKACRDIGCDFIQGFLVARPILEFAPLQERYAVIERLNAAERRGRPGEDRFRIASNMAQPPPVPHNATLPEVCRVFKESHDIDFVPVINGNDEPLGILRERDLKPYIYSRYGQELLQNPTYGGSIVRFIRRVPVADIHTPVEKILEIYSQNAAFEGILIVEDMRYRGFLTPPSLLSVIHEKNLVMARDQNPLSKLPGNTSIHEFIGSALGDEANDYNLVYFDFDNFKPFNDRYGFRQGDRIILRFAELLRTLAQETGGLAGHIGGDDFFWGLQQKMPLNQLIERITALTARFKRDAESFYDTETISRGFLEAVDRDGCKKRLPFLRASAALLHLPAMKRDFCSIETLSHFMARIKKAAKNSPAGLCLGIMGTLEISDAGISEELLAALAQTRTAVYIAEPPDVFPRRLAPWTPSVPPGENIRTPRLGKVPQAVIPLPQPASRDSDKIDPLAC